MITKTKFKVKGESEIEKGRKVVTKNIARRFRIQIKAFAEVVFSQQSFLYCAVSSGFPVLLTIFFWIRSNRSFRFCEHYSEKEKTRESKMSFRILSKKLGSNWLEKWA